MPCLASVEEVPAETNRNQARAGFTLGDASNFAALYEGAGGNTLAFNNSNVTGNIGIGATGKFQGNGPGTITGAVEFSAANTGQFSNSGLTITGGTLFSQGNVQTDLNALNTLSQNLSAEVGTALTFGNGGSLTASSGTLDGTGNRVFTVTTLGSFDNGNNFTITGAASDFVVINVHSTGGHGFNGDIVLAGGITSDHVLINLTAGNYATLSGGDTLTISTNGGATTGTFLDVNGDFSINHSVLNGRIFGGDTHNSSIQSGADIVMPPSSVPEPSLLGLLSAAFLVLIGVQVRRNRRPRSLGL
jgi:hypothetical protein